MVAQGIIGNNLTNVPTTLKTFMPVRRNISRSTEFKNPVKEQLNKGKVVIGPVISVNNVEVAAQCAALGFDFIWLEMEHAPLSLETVRNVVLATRGLPAVPFARPPVNELWMAKQVLDAGVLGVIFPFTRTPELARQAAAACRYPPRGLRGSGAWLAHFRWPAQQGYYDGTTSEGMNALAADLKMLLKEERIKAREKAKNS